MSRHLNRFIFLVLMGIIAFPVMAFSKENNCKHMQRLLDEFRRNHKIVGMGLFASSTLPSTSACYLFSGSVKSGSDDSIGKNKLFQIGSISKSYFAAVLLQLEAESEEGKLPIIFNINQKLKLWLPEYQEWGNVTIKQLLNMTSGIYSYTELPDFTQTIVKKLKKNWTADELTELAYKHKPNTYFAPGKGWHYSDTAYIIIGQLIQEIYKKIAKHKPLLQTILKQRILDKLCLKDTYYYTNELPKHIASRMVHGYGYYTHKDFTLVNLSSAGPSGAMISNPREISEWIYALFNQDVLPKKQLSEMQSLVSTKTGQPVRIVETTIVPGYSLGLMEQFSKTLGPVWIYEGVTFGYTAVYVYAPKRNVIVSITANVGSIKDNPIQFSKFALKILRRTLLN